MRGAWDAISSPNPRNCRLERGEARKVIEPRIYRAAFLPALFALVLVAFSLESPPRAAPQGLAADALFEGVGTASLVRDIATTTPDRRAGRPDDAAVASRVKQAFLSHGFSTTIDRFDQDGTKLVNVIGRRPGSTNKQIVVMAARDAATIPDEAGSAADTAALIEFARVFEGRASKKTLVLASVDGGQLGDAGARHLADTLSGSGQVEAVIVLSNLGATRSSGPLVLGWSNDIGRGNLGIERTVASSLREELASIPHQEGAFAQFARLTFPIAPGAQGVLLPAGVDAVRVSGSGELRPPGSGRRLDVLRYGSLGRSALRAVSALDAAPETPKHGPGTYIQFAGKVMPVWPVRLLALAVVLAWILGRSSVIRRAASLPDPSAPGAACVTSLAMGLLVLVIVFTNPFAALLLVPAVHLWMLGTMTDASWRTGVSLYVIGLLPIALVAAYYMVRLDLGPIDGAWYLFLLVTGNQTGVFTTVGLMFLAAITGSVGAILLARARHGEPVGERRGGGRQAEPPPPIFGPGGHAGPGAIGQARSTLGR